MFSVNPGLDLSLDPVRGKTGITIEITIGRRLFGCHRLSLGM